MSIERSDIAIRLTEERGRLGYSKRDFAEKIGIAGETLRRYEAGQREISLEFLAQTATFGVDVQYVLIGFRSKNTDEAEKALVPTITIESSTGVIGVVQSGAIVKQINTRKHVEKTIAEVKPGLEHINEKQASTLQMLVQTVYETEQKLKSKPKSHRAIWGALNAYCGVSRYRLISLDDYPRAEKYLRQWVGRLNSMVTAPVKDGDAWRKRKYSYIKINSKDDAESVSRYISRNFKAKSLTELSNDELEKTYRYVASRKKRK